MPNWLLFRIIRGRPRLFVGLGVALVSFVVLGPLQRPAARAVLAWDIGSMVFLALAAEMFLRSENRDIMADAEAQQEGEWSIFGLTLIGAVMSLVAIFLFTGTHHAADKKLYFGFVVLTLALSWLVTQVTFTYRYAHEYYSADWTREPRQIERGIEFPNDDQPDYLDFVYFSFVLGMTFQVADCNMTSKKMRRLATLHGLISFMFNTVILAFSVNIAASAL